MSRNGRPRRGRRRTFPYAPSRAKQHAEVAADRRAMVGTGDRSERIRTYNFPQGRMTDHRIGLTLYNLAAFIDGDIEEVVAALRSHYQAEALNSQSEVRA